MTATGGFTFTTAHRMVNRIHGRAPHVGTAAQPSLAARLAQPHRHVVRITDFADRGPATDRGRYVTALIYPAEYEGWYCVPCERFFTEKDLVASTCPECGRVLPRKRPLCMYCGTAVQQDPFER